MECAEKTLLQHRKPKRSLPSLPLPPLVLAAESALTKSEIQKTNTTATGTNDYRSEYDPSAGEYAKTRDDDDDSGDIADDEADYHESAEAADSGSDIAGENELVAGLWTVGMEGQQSVPDVDGSWVENAMDIDPRSQHGMNDELVTGWSGVTMFRQGDNEGMDSGSQHGIMNLLVAGLSEAMIFRKVDAGADAEGGGGVDEGSTTDADSESQRRQNDANMVPGKKKRMLHDIEEDTVISDGSGSATDSDSNSQRRRINDEMAAARTKRVRLAIETNGLTGDTFGGVTDPRKCQKNIWDTRNRCLDDNAVKNYTTVRDFAHVTPHRCHVYTTVAAGQLADYDPKGDDQNSDGFGNGTETDYHAQVGINEGLVNGRLGVAVFRQSDGDADIMMSSDGLGVSETCKKRKWDVK